MKRLLIAAIAALAAAAPAGAQTGSAPEDIALGAHDACYGVQRGSALSILADAQGFRPSTRTTGVYVRNLPGLEFQLSITDKAQPSGRTLRMCSLGIWGRVAGFGRVQGTLVARGRSQGFTVTDPAPRAKGGTDQMIYKETPTEAHVIGITVNEGNDPTKGANYVITYGWLM
jgi:hypothetical protein